MGGYLLGAVLGFLMIPAIIFLAAVILARWKATGTLAWIVLAVGIVLTILSLVGTSKNLSFYEMYGMGDVGSNLLTAEIVASLILGGLATFLVSHQQEKRKEREQAAEPEQTTQKTEEPSSEE